MFIHPTDYAQALCFHCALYQGQASLHSLCEMGKLLMHQDLEGVYSICVNVCVYVQDLTGGGFEQNLASLNLKEGEDYYHFS